jgi:hypothetical protein
MAGIAGRSVLSPDLGGLFVVGDHGLLVVDPQRLGVRGQWASAQTFKSLAASTDGNRLYGFAGARLVRLDARSGAIERSLPLGFEPVAILGVHPV